MIWIQLDGQGPRYLQIYRAVREAVLSSRLPAGSRLPSSRRLASELGVSRNTVLLAFDQLRSEGFLEGRHGAGSYVSSSIDDRLLEAPAREAPTPNLPRLSQVGRRLAGQPNPFAELLVEPRPPFDFMYGIPAIQDLPHDLLSRLTARLARRRSVRSFVYGAPGGDERLRARVADYLRRLRGVETCPERIIIVGGFSQALELLLRVLVDPGGKVAMEEPGYPPMAMAIEAAGWGDSRCRWTKRGWTCRTWRRLGRTSPWSS